jgi:hypothetical protein
VSDYDDGYADGLADGETSALDSIEKMDPRELINAIPFLDRQDWFDRLKLEAIRLGVSP